MVNNTQYNFFAGVLRDVGLSKCPGFYRDARFIFAMLAGILVVWFIHEQAPIFSSDFQFQWLAILSVVIWQPLTEELLFRGIIQGQLGKYKWARKRILEISAANVMTSVLFVLLHMFNEVSIWPLLVFIPSLVFGYFRDLFNSVYPSVFLHVCYNLFVIIGLYIHIY